MSRAILLAVFIILTLKSSLAAGLSPCPIKQSPPAFDHKSVSLEGVVADLKETTSRAGNDYSTFMLNDKAGCGIMVFTWGHPQISNGSAVHIDGVFEVEHHQGKYTFYNEVQATSVAAGH